MKEAAIQIVFGLERKVCVFIFYNLVIFILFKQHKDTPTHNHF